MKKDINHYYVDFEDMFKHFHDIILTHNIKNQHHFQIPSHMNTDHIITIDFKIFTFV